jgi:hypothetical protein
MANKTVALCAALGVLAAVAMTQVASASHPRPKGATPLRVSLVPAYKACAAPNRTHGAPLAFPSCNPAVQESNFLTVGTPDANGAGANATGFIRLKVGPASFNGELNVTSTITDVRCLPGTAAGVCSGANAADGPDYSGQLQGNATLRISDHYNGPNRDEAATVVEIPFPLNAFCVNTADTSTGGTCTITTSCMLPEGCSNANRRTVIEMGQFVVMDGGPDGNVATTDNTVFMRQGLFIP